MNETLEGKTPEAPVAEKAEVPAAEKQEAVKPADIYSQEFRDLSPKKQEEIRTARKNERAAENIKGNLGQLDTAIAQMKSLFEKRAAMVDIAAATDPDLAALVEDLAMYAQTAEGDVVRANGLMMVARQSVNMGALVEPYVLSAQAMLSTIVNKRNEAMTEQQKRQAEKQAAAAAAQGATKKGGMFSRFFGGKK